MPAASDSAASITYPSLLTGYQLTKMPAIVAKSAQIGQLCTQPVPRPGVARAMPNGGYLRGARPQSCHRR